jgi:Arc-like DNA binding domain
MARKPTDMVALQVRLTEGLRRKLANAADKNGRSLNAEIVWRLGQSAGNEGDFEQYEAEQARQRKVLDEIVQRLSRIDGK